jgi:hypothetical protein
LFVLEVGKAKDLSALLRKCACEGQWQIIAVLFARIFHYQYGPRRSTLAA